METIDYAVVGAGSGGVYAAWRLQEDRPSATVRILEASDRVGGRLESLVPPGAPNLRAEFGGMGYDTNHLLVEAVVDALKLPTAPFPSSGPAYAWLRGVPLLGTQLTDASAIPYHLPPDEQGTSFASLLADRVNADLGIDVGAMTHADWLAVGARTKVLGTPLHEVGFWNYLATILSAEGFSYVQDTMGHDFPVENFNALDMLEWFFADFAPGTTDTTLAGGYDQLPIAIAERFEAAGGQLALDTEVVRVTQAADGTIALALGDGSEVRAKAVILALPRRAIELISPGSVVLDTTSMRALLATVVPIPVMKLFLAYDRPWWTDPGVAGVWGHSVSTLPLRTTYYFGEEATAPGGDPANHNSLLMASYTDSLQLSYWEGLRQGPAFTPGENPYTGATPGSPAWHRQQATASMVEAATRQLWQLHQRDPSEVPAPYAAAFKDWGDDPYGGAMHAWAVGADSDTAMAAALQPDPRVPLYVCGEAFSRFQGWVEGAFDTAETVLQQRLGLAPPAFAPSWQPPSGGRH